MCEEVNLAGVLGEAISTVSNSDLLSVLDITSLLSLSGGGGPGGILGKGTSSLGILGGGGLAGGLGGTLSKGTASLGILGGGGLAGGLSGGLAGGLGGILGQENGKKSPKYSAPLLSGGTDAVSDLTSMSQEALGRPPLTSAEKNPVKEAVDSTGLLDSNKESTEGILNSVAPEGINNGLKSLLGNVNVENLLVG